MNKQLLHICRARRGLSPLNRRTRAFRVNIITVIVGAAFVAAAHIIATIAKS